jgi:predicted nucleic acid-binding protein
LGEDTIDQALLPDVALFDTTVLIPALSVVRATDDPACQMLFQAMVAARKKILIAAPSMAEIFRRAPKASVPRTQSVQIVSFDLKAAEILGTKFPPHALVRLAQVTGRPKDYIKYDCMIVACASRHDVKMMVTVDKKQRHLAELVGLRVMAPSDFLAAQRRLPHT